MERSDRITIEPGKRGGKPCIRGLRITVDDVLGHLAAGMTEEEILTDFPSLEPKDIRACREFAEERKRGVLDLSRRSRSRRGGRSWTRDDLHDRGSLRPGDAAAEADSRPPLRIELLDPEVADVYRGMTPAERLRAAFEMIDLTRRVVRGSLRSLHPDWSDERIEEAVGSRPG